MNRAVLNADIKRSLDRDTRRRDRQPSVRNQGSQRIEATIEHVCGELLILGKSVIRHTHVRQIELCERHCDIAIERERARGLEICDRRNE